MIHHPWFIADIPGWKNEGVSEGEVFIDDRLFLETAIKKKEISRQMPHTVSTLLCDSGKRFFFQSSFHCREVHEEFVKAHCARTEESLEAASAQLTNVLSLYPDLVDTKGVRAVKQFLEKDL